MSIQIIDAYIKKFEGEDDEPTSDVLCKVICLSPGTSVSKLEGMEDSQSYLSAYCFDPETGIVVNVKLEHLTINSYYNENKVITAVNQPSRVNIREENGERDNSAINNKAR